jgi:Fe-S cluster assembly protein SufD
VNAAVALAPFAAARAAAQARLAAIGAPTTAAEAWRYVDVKPLSTPPATAPRAVTAAEVDARRLPGSRVVVLVDGVPQPQLGDEDTGAESLSSLPPADMAALGERWAAAAAAEDDVTSLWSLADLAGGLRLRLAGAAPFPLHIISFATGGCSGARLVITAARGAAADLVLQHVALGPARSSLGIELDLAEGAALRVDELQLDDAGQLFSLAWPRLARDASLAWTAVGLGGQCVRSRCAASLDGANAAIALAGLVVLGGARQAHQHLRVRHAVGRTRSQQVFKTIADGRAIASFDGLVAMDRGADGSEAEQTNHNLLLSTGARVDTRPQLDILADDVKASHGATIGQLDAEELFYLRARGLPAAEARALLIEGFAVELLDRLCNAGARRVASAAALATIGHHA